MHQIIERYGECFLVLDGAPGHTSWQQEELFSIPGLTVLDWPGNSPDLNQIEPAWYAIKREVTNRGGAVANREITKRIWEGVWKDLEKRKVQGWCGKMEARLRLCGEKGGDNRFHG